MSWRRQRQTAWAATHRRSDGVGRHHGLSSDRQPRGPYHANHRRRETRYVAALQPRVGGKLFNSGLGHSVPSGTRRVACMYARPVPCLGSRLRTCALAVVLPPCGLIRRMRTRRSGLMGLVGPCFSVCDDCGFMTRAREQLACRRESGARLCDTGAGAERGRNFPPRAAISWPTRNPKFLLVSSRKSAQLSLFQSRLWATRERARTRPPIIALTQYAAAFRHVSVQYSGCQKH